MISNLSQESLVKEKIYKRKRNEVLSQVSFGGSLGISDKTTIASSEKNNYNCIENSILSSDFNNRNLDFKYNKEHIPSFLKKHSGNNQNFNFYNNSINVSNKNKFSIDHKKFSFLGKTENFNLNNNKSNNNSILGNSKINGFFEKKKSGYDDKPIQVNDSNHPHESNRSNNSNGIIEMGITNENLCKKIISEDQNLSVNNLEKKNLYIKPNNPKNIDLETNQKNLSSIKPNIANLTSYENKNEYSSNYCNLNQNNNSDKDLKKSSNDICFINPNISNYEIITAKNPNLLNYKKNTNIKSNSITNSKDNLTDFITNIPNNVNSCTLLANSKNKLISTEYRDDPNTELISDNYLKDPDIKKFNSWNNTRKIDNLLPNNNMINNRILEESNNLNNEFSIFNTVNGQQKFYEKRISLPHQKSNNNLPICLGIFEKKPNSAKNDNIEKQKSKLKNIKNLQVNKDDLINKSNDFHLNLLKTNQDRVNIKHNLNIYSDISDDFNKDITNLKKNFNEEFSDNENNFSLEAKFITNNKKIIINDKIKSSGKANIKVNRIENNINSEFIKNQNKIYNDDNNENYFNNNLLLNNSKKTNCIDKYLQSTNINDCKIINNFCSNENYKFNNNSFEKEKNLKLNESFNSAMSCEFIGNIPANFQNNPKFSINNDLISNNVLKKFNTSDAVKPPKIFLEIKELTRNSNIDPMLIVNAEIGDKKKLIINKRNSYTSSIQRSNRSTSNDSKEFSNSNINMNNYSSKEGNINFSANAYNLSNKDNSGQNFTALNINYNQHTKEKDQINSQNIEDINGKTKEKSQANKFNPINSNLNNIDLSIKKKQNPKNQIFFPTEINMINFKKDAK